MNEKTYIGTSGYDYKIECNNLYSCNLYPKKMTSIKKLQYYSNNLFNFVEINSTFYRMPNKKNCEKWYQNTPDNFRFVCKFSRYSTHTKRLYDFPLCFDKFLDNCIVPLKEKCLGVLFQFSGKFINNSNKSKKDNLTMIERVEFAFKYLNKLKKENKINETLLFFVEFYHSSWFNSIVYNLCVKYKIIFVLHHLNNEKKNYSNDLDSGFCYNLDDYISTYPLDHIYLRFHGTNEIRYKGRYTEKFMDKISSIIKRYSNKKFIVAFNNTDSHKEYISIDRETNKLNLYIEMDYIYNSSYLQKKINEEI